MNLCFIGGGNHLNGELDNVLKQLSYYVKTNDKILIVPFATEPNKYESWHFTIKEAFKLLGIEKVELLNYNLSSDEMINQINEHQILYFIGGRPEKLLDRLHNKGLIQTVKAFPGKMIGFSAGALAFCNDCIISKDDDYPQSIVLNGLGLVDFSVEVHYEDTIDEELFSLSKSREIYAIPNGGGIFWDGKKVKTINDVYYFNNLKKQKITE